MDIQGYVNALSIGEAIEYWEAHRNGEVAMAVCEHIARFGPLYTEEEMEDIRLRIAEEESRADVLARDLEETEANVQDLETDLANAEEEIASLQDDLSSYRERAHADE